MRNSQVRRLAHSLMRLAARLMPEERRDWAVAMRSELPSLEGDYLAVGWALGCLAAAIRMRVSEMMTGNLRISKPVLVLEMACCFVPLTLFWLIVLFDRSGGTSLNPQVIKQYFLAPDGVIILVYIFSMAVFGIFGPIGLLIAFRHIVLERRVRNRLLSIALIVGPTLLGVVYVGTTLVLGGPGPGRLIGWLGGVVLFTILPIVGAAHLRYLGWPPTQRSAA